jgi:hypothetical protein
MSAMRGSRITLSPYFQRNLVWRDAHRKDFIDTILKGYPFPQIFLARGPINVDTMESSQAVVDGQQRLNAIKDFINGKLEVGGKFFKQLPINEREEFLKYEVPVIDFDLDVGDERLKDIFHRLNRTYYSLSAIEKLASEYSASEFMLVARTLSGEILKSPIGDYDLTVDSEDGSDTIAENLFSRDPGVDENLWNWIVSKSEGALSLIIRQKPIFSNFEFDRKVPLMFSLNLLCTYLSGYYNRNDRVRKYLDEYADSFPDKEDVIKYLDLSAEYIKSLRIPVSSMWWNKANFFTLVVEIAREPMILKRDPDVLSKKLMVFEASVPQDYGLAAREAVNGKAQRELRGSFVRKVLSE